MTVNKAEVQKHVYEYTMDFNSHENLTMGGAIKAFALPKKAKTTEFTSSAALVNKFKIILVGET